MPPVASLSKKTPALDACRVGDPSWSSIETGALLGSCVRILNRVVFIAAFFHEQISASGSEIDEKS